MSNDSLVRGLISFEKPAQQPSFYIKLYLSASLVILSILPLLAAYALVDEILEDVVSLSVHQDVVMVFEAYTRDLKVLADLNPGNEAVYKKQFEDINDLLVVYKNPEDIVRILKDAYFSYFFIVFIVVVGLALVMAFFLSRQVAKNYDELIGELLERNDRIKQLSQFEQWQRVSANLAHEIKNPLTPIEMMVGNLHKSYKKLDPGAYQDMLDNTRRIVDSELSRLKNMVHHFTQFAKLPSPKFEKTDMRKFAGNFISDAGVMWPGIEFSFTTLAGPSETDNDAFIAEIDPQLITQCLVNIINNAFDANDGSRVLHVGVTLSVSKSKVHVSVENDGLPIAADIREKVFEIAYSTKRVKTSMGLGLAIVKKVMLDHHANIRCESRAEGACFTMAFPRVYPYE